MLRRKWNSRIVIHTSEKYKLSVHFGGVQLKIGMFFSPPVPLLVVHPREL
jgi:hypothetical protein